MITMLRNHLSPRRLLAVAALAGALAGLAGFQPAQAAAIDLACAGSQTFTYSPGLHLTARPVTVSGAGSFSCPVSADPALSSGGFTVPGFTATLGCGLTGNTGTFTYSWNNGQTSTVLSTSDVTFNLGTVVTEARGTVIAGEFTGDTTVFTWTGTSPGLLDCLSPSGVRQYSGPITLTFSSL
jgi:hypothetical protein